MRTTLKRVAGFAVRSAIFLFVLFPAGSSVQAQTSFTAIDFPGAAETEVLGINPKGDIVGVYSIGDVLHGFLLSGGTFSTIDVPFPGTTVTRAAGINPKGDIVGIYRSAGVQHGFLLSR